jgi:hypothetical protein
MRFCCSPRIPDPTHHRAFSADALAASRLGQRGQRARGDPRCSSPRRVGTSRRSIAVDLPRSALHARPPACYGCRAAVTRPSVVGLLAVMSGPPRPPPEIARRSGDLNTEGTGPSLVAGGQVGLAPKTAASSCIPAVCGGIERSSRPARRGTRVLGNFLAFAEGGGWEGIGSRHAGCRKIHDRASRSSSSRGSVRRRLGLSRASAGTPPTHNTTSSARACAQVIDPNEVGRRLAELRGLRRLACRQNARKRFSVGFFAPSCRFPPSWRRRPTAHRRVRVANARGVAAARPLD